MCQETPRQGLRPLRPQTRNILIDRHGTIKICDFGCAQWVAGTPSDKLFVPLFVPEGTHDFNPPELREGLDDILRSLWRVDVFQVGLIIYRILTLRLPWEDTLPNVVSAVDAWHSHEVAQLGASLLPQHRYLLKLALSFDQLNRPTVAAMKAYWRKWEVGGPGRYVNGVFVRDDDLWKLTTDFGLRFVNWQDNLKSFDESDPSLDPIIPLFVHYVFHHVTHKYHEAPHWKIFQGLFDDFKKDVPEPQVRTGKVFTCGKWWIQHNLYPYLRMALYDRDFNPQLSV
ncbi:Aste57867_19740 [Aphanomyces stellatus]|uniref:Aste57867_19740 protein n=1 Tax=Aphanomyces stellatus TaxID=120398 RepID=A0A485LEG3_9STRA|nr:hypothetical protein As57867_019675 [Aphanomyces stellatus]VFT96438.1 Aste57867_19740 [Aphanomyces stellatus]